MKTVLARPGSLYVGKVEDHDAIVIADASAGWMVPKGIRHWENEVTVISRDDITDAVRAQVKATFPEEQIPPAKLPLAFHAASSSPFVAVSRKLVPELVALGIRAHTIGADRTSSGFFYFAEGGSEGPVRIQGELLTLIGPTLTGDETTALIEQHLESVIDRLLHHLSKGTLSEVAVELAAALPRLNADGTGLEGVDLDAFEQEAQQMVAAGKGWEKEARQVSEALQNSEGPSAPVALFGIAKREPQFELVAELDGTKVTLPRRPRWTVRGEPSRTIAAGTSPSTPPPPVAPVPAAQPVAKAPEVRPIAAAPAPATPRVAPIAASAKAPASARNQPAAPPASAPKMGTAATRAAEPKASPKAPPVQDAPKPAPQIAKIAEPKPSPKAPPVQEAPKPAAETPKPVRVDAPTPLKPMPITMLNEIRNDAAASKEATPKAQPVAEKLAEATKPAVAEVQAAPAPAPAPAPVEPAPVPAAPASAPQVAAAAPQVAAPTPAPAPVAETPKPVKTEPKPERTEAAAKPEAKPLAKADAKATPAKEAPSGGAGKIAIVFVLLLVAAVAAYLFMKR